MADYSHFVAKIASEKGPEPANEFRALIDQCRRHPQTVAWFATWHVAERFVRAGNSTCVLFYHPDSSEQVEAIVARILDKGDKGLPPDEVTSFYEPWRNRLHNWWPLGGRRPGKLADIVLTRFNSLADLPGRAWESRRLASQTFVGQVSFAGWTFDTDPLEWAQSLPGDRP